MNKNYWSALALAWLLVPPAFAEQVEIQVNIHELDSAMYYRPYVAVWVEDAQENSIKTLSVWRKEADWLKDMRRWWRKAGRYDQGELDSVTGATRRPGSYPVIWDGKDQQGKTVPAGRYIINIEAAREHGSRSLIRQPIELGAGPLSYSTEAAEELGSITIQVKN